MYGRGHGRESERDSVLKSACVFVEREEGRARERERVRETERECVC